MSYDTEKKMLGREPTVVVELDLDYCSLGFGASPCSATGEPCYNTLTTCKDSVNYTKTTKTYRMIDQEANIPIGEIMYPCVKSVSYSPTKLTFGEGLAYRSKVSITLQDFNHHDRGIDPYQSQRAYDTTQGTFFGKLIARNSYYNGRTIRVRTGYTGVESLWNDATLWDDAAIWNDTTDFLSNLNTREYIISSIDIDANGIVKITALDILKKIDNKRSQCPSPSSGVLSADLTDIATSLTLLPAGIGSEYTTSGTIRIGKEIMDYTTLTGDVISGITRNGYGTTAESHTADDSVQLCKVYNVNVVDIIYDLLVNYANIDPKYIPYNNDPLNKDEWDTEKENWLSLKTYYTVLSKPTGVQDLIEELTEQSLILFWWDELAQKIKLRVIAPPQQGELVKSINEDSHILENSVRIKNDNSKRYSELWVYYGVKNWAEVKDEDDYSTLYIKAELDKEGADQYGDKRIKKIKSRWYTSDSHASVTADRYMLMSKDTPRIITLKVDAKDSDINTGNFLDISTRLVLDKTGASLASRYHVTEVKENKIGQEHQITAMTSGFALDVRYGYIAPNVTPDYSAATDEQKRVMAFISPNSGIFSDGSESYKII